MIRNGIQTFFILKPNKQLIRIQIIRYTSVNNLLLILTSYLPSFSSS